MADESVVSTGLDTTTIPDKSAAPEVGKLPPHYGKIHNLAGDKALCEQFRKWASKQIERFEGQDARDQYVKDNGTADIADKMYRCSLNNTTAGTRTKETLSDVTSPVFRVAVRAIHSAETAIMFSDENLPAEYEPEVNTTEWHEEDGTAIAEQQNALQQLTFDEDKRIPKIKELNEMVKVYGMYVAVDEWVYKTKEVTELEPDFKAGKNPNGTWVKVRPVTKKRVVKDHPNLWLDEIANWYFDANIGDTDMAGSLENQICVGHRGRVGIDELYSEQADGHIMNVGLLSANQLYKGDNSDSPLEARMRNAGEDGSTSETGELIKWRVWGKVPISESDTPKTKKHKAVWDGSKNVPTLYEAIFAGDIHSGLAVCLQLRKLPHWHGRIPARIIRSHRDKKGAFSVGYADMMKSLYWQDVDNINQANDNVTERNWAPAVIKGQCYTRDLTFKKNKAIKMSTNGSYERVDVPDTTQITMEMSSAIKKMIDDLFGANKPMRGEYAGARATATENVNVVNFASQPLEEGAAYFMDQLFPWMFELDASYWRQYGDPDTTLFVTHNNKEYEINPTQLWGPLKTKVTAIARFKRSTMEKQALMQSLRDIYPLFREDTPPAGRRTLFREALHALGVPKTNEISPATGDVEATAAAKQAIEVMLTGGFVVPQPGENHQAWLGVLRPALNEYGALPKSSRPEGDFIDLLRTHIEMRQDMAQQEQSSIQPGQSSATPPSEGFGGQATGDMLAAGAGGNQAV